MPAILSGYLQQRRIQAVAPHLKGDILDLGCGDGRLAAYVAAGCSYVGVDGREALLPALRARFPAFTFYCRELDHEPLALTQRFDTIALLALVEHLAQPDWLLGQLAGYLKPRGCVVITTPSPVGDRIHQAGARVGLFSYEAMQDHKIIFDRATLAERLTHSGLRLRLFHRFLLGGNQLFVAEPRAASGAD